MASLVKIVGRVCNLPRAATKARVLSLLVLGVFNLLVLVTGEDIKRLLIFCKLNSGFTQIIPKATTIVLKEIVVYSGSHIHFTNHIEIITQLRIRKSLG